MRKNYTVISSTYVAQAALGKRPARTWLAGVALLTAREQWGKWQLNVQIGVALVGDNVWDVPLWLSKNLKTPTTLVGWRLDDIVVPSLIAAADTCGDPAIARECLRSLEGALTDEVVDLAATQGGAGAPRLCAAAEAVGVPVPSLSGAGLDEIWRTGCLADMRDHVSARALSLWLMFLADPARADEEMRKATAAWIDTLDQPWAAPHRNGGAK